MKLPSTIIVLFASLLIIGCATKQQQLTPSNHPTKKWEKNIASIDRDLPPPARSRDSDTLRAPALIRVNWKRPLIFAYI
jgi:hypothetical protein